MNKENSEECYVGVSNYVSGFTKKALEGPDCTRKEAQDAMKPSNHEKKLSEYYPSLKDYKL